MDGIYGQYFFLSFVWLIADAAAECALRPDMAACVHRRSMLLLMGG